MRSFCGKLKLEVDHGVLTFLVCISFSTSLNIVFHYSFSDSCVTVLVFLSPDSHRYVAIK